MDRKQNIPPHEPSLEEEVQRVLRAGEQAKQAEEEEIRHDIDQASGSTATAREYATDWPAEESDTSRAAIDRIKEKIEHADETLPTGMTSGVSQGSTSIANQVKDTAKEVANTLRSSNVSEVADNVKQKASEASSQMTEQTDAALNTTGQRLEGFADTLRTNAPSGTAGTVASKAAEALEQSGQYLQQHSTSDIIADLTELVRRRPIPSVLVALGIGYLLVRANRKDDRYRYYR